MPKIAYVDRRVGAGVLEVVGQANAIIEEYGRQGFRLTLRQLYYQFVSRDLIENNVRSYKRLGDSVNTGRLAGLIDWDAIEDRTRNLCGVAHWSGPAEIVRACAEQFRMDKWAGQPFRVEVWIEKEALAGVVEGICRELDIAYFSCRGYTSQSEMWVAGMRLKRYVREGQTPLILHFGDHDPSGIDMTRDIGERLEMFMGGVEIRRLALNMEQIEEYAPPPNPAKVTDSRYEGYAARFGDESWELDALEPRLLASLIRGEVAGVRDLAAWEKAVKAEMKHRKRLSEIAGGL